MLIYYSKIVFEYACMYSILNKILFTLKLFDTAVVLEEEKCHLKDRLKVKVTLEGQINELFRAITPTYVHGFQNYFAQVFPLKSRGAI